MFLLCLVNLGESRLKRPRHHMKEYVQENGWLGCHETHDPYTENLVINRVDGNKETRTVYTADLSSLYGLVAAKYPLLLEITDYFMEHSEPFYNSKITSTLGHVTLEIQAAQKGEGFCDYTAQIKTVHIKKCYGKETHRRETFENRFITEGERKTILNAIKDKIGILPNPKF
ncbi:hypothetical protein TVAG_046290 [Trichomonas vaginalis G3]|uniref:Uncharacterized protein n=1 Tax=Trichomonas vaginalis (strain ATCC PRA-98 / G3) TaxID=412133 RepID=A2DMJ8_TRIV3|nr:hypothetical protein TVAGG3_0336300 [Trichomonas vaginalis G3]EAY18425.1 hypothetical protein TVAG_046290 [Trichomonas vaginalis G3]KAI5530296.1 hypothetical protein TVAGG3_0336300 [Trichomonas vaginalis G3]|eukprot:XP_001579411.1 hypothetical protein [Trichomonas vaginalis G3]